MSGQCTVGHLECEHIVGMLFSARNPNYGLPHFISCWYWSQQWAAHSLIQFFKSLPKTSWLINWLIDHIFFKLQIEKNLEFHITFLFFLCFKENVKLRSRCVNTYEPRFMTPEAWKKWKKKVKGVYIQNIPKNGKKINSPKKQQYEVMENCFGLGEKERKPLLRLL